MSLTRNHKKPSSTGAALLITLVLLIVLATLAYTTTSKVLQRKHRLNYLINYQAARYACDSALKYAIANLEEIKTPGLISRPNEPDFSDLFAYDNETYQKIIDNLKARQQSEAQEDMQSLMQGLASMFDTGGSNSPNDFKDPNEPNDPDRLAKPNSAQLTNMMSENIQTPDPCIPGPYGAKWPLIKEADKFTIGDTEVSIEIHDENAKFPILWLMVDHEDKNRAADAAFATFCEWMKITENESEDIKFQLSKLKDIKNFEFDPKETKTQVIKQDDQQDQTKSQRGRRRNARSNIQTETVPSIVHTRDYANLLHSPLLDSQPLARLTWESEERNESALKYIGMWGSKQVNINTAPRHVLEAAFTFGGDSVAIADAVIKRRNEKPFSSLEELSSEMLGYSDSIRKCEPYITTESNFFTIKVTARQGRAECSAVVAVKRKPKEKDSDDNTVKFEKVAVISS